MSSPTGEHFHEPQENVTVFPQNAPHSSPPRKSYTWLMWVALILAGSAIIALLLASDLDGDSGKHAKSPRRNKSERSGNRSKRNSDDEDDEDEEEDEDEDEEPPSSKPSRKRAPSRRRESSPTVVVYGSSVPAGNPASSTTNTPGGQS